MGLKAVQLLLAVLVYCGALNGGDQTLRAEVEKPIVNYSDAGDPGVVMYNILFDLRITNLGKRVLNVGRTPIVVLAIQNRGADGTWNNLNENSWYDDGTVKYDSCSPLSPGGTKVVSGVDTGLSLLSAQSAKLGDQPVLRFEVQIFCKQRGGTVSGTSVFTTEPITVQLPGPIKADQPPAGDLKRYNTAWTSRKAITIDHTKIYGSSNLTSFPVLFSVADANLKTVSNGGSAGKTDGTDILFTTSDGVTKLNHEIESYNQATGQLIAWVNVPSFLPTADTVLYIYYGNASASNQQNPTGVWDGNYKGVWHLPNGTTLAINDSTSNANNGTVNGTVTAGSGQVDGAASLAGSAGSNIQIPYSASRSLLAMAETTYASHRRYSNCDYSEPYHSDKPMHVVRASSKHAPVV